MMHPGEYLKTIAVGLVLLGRAFLLDTAGAACLDPKTHVSGYKIPLASEIRTANAIVIGRVLSERGLREDPNDPDGYTAYDVRIEVIDRLKGRLPRVIIVRNDNTSARYPMSVGEEHLLFVSRDGNELRVDSCGNSSAMPAGDQLVKQIRALNALAQTPPPTVPFNAINAKATMTRSPATGLHMGTLFVRFERTTLDDVRRAASVGAIVHRGDAGESAYWLCYTNTGAIPVERIWIMSHGEMGGSEHYVTDISAEALPDGGATGDCPALPNRLTPLSLANHVWIGTSQRRATSTLGAPSFRKAAWRSYDFQAKVPGNCEGGGFDRTATLLLHFQNGRVNVLHAGQGTSC
jgi:hypothetical protein